MIRIRRVCPDPREAWELYDGSNTGRNLSRPQWKFARGTLLHVPIDRG